MHAGTRGQPADSDQHLRDGIDVSLPRFWKELLHYNTAVWCDEL